MCFLFVCVLFVSCVRLNATLLAVFSRSLQIMFSAIFIKYCEWKSSPEAAGVAVVLTCVCAGISQAFRSVFLNLLETISGLA